MLNKADNASIYAAASIVHRRPDPRYMERLIDFIANDRLRPQTLWRVLRVVQETHNDYKFSAEGEETLIANLKKAAERFQPPAGPFP